MKKISKYLFLIVPLLILGACKDDLDVVNPNEPGLQVLDNEEGITRALAGTYSFFGGFYVWVAQAHHECMGDAIVIPWGNFGWRWANQPTTIELDDGRVWTPPQGGTQEEQLVLFNDRAQGDGNAFIHEWRTAYQLNNHANLLLNKLDEGTVEFSGDAENKQNTIRAWAHFWKGWAYSRLGSLYSAGVIIDEFNSTNDNFVSNTDLIVEANRQLDLAADFCGRITDDAIFTDLLLRAIPSYTRQGDMVPSPQEMIRNINTQKARNILVNNKYFTEMDAAKWTEVRNLTEAGLQEGDAILEFRTASENASFAESVFVPFRMLIGWHFLSERLVQDFQPGDQRRDRNVFELATPEVNIRGRGIQYGTRWGLTDITQGGDWASTTAGLASLPVAGSWEENQLMLAEALISTGDVAGGLALVDQVRTAQNAGLDPVSGVITDEDEALLELYSERRIGLFLRGLSFYDARRFGLTEDANTSDFGGRPEAVVLDENGNVNTDAFINYNYMDYWGVPDNELDFNVPAPGSPSVDPI